MRSYVMASGDIFAAVVVVHVLRLWAEGLAVIANPAFLVSTGVSAAMAVWASYSLRFIPR
jgi:hypothetical protein